MPADRSLEVRVKLARAGGGFSLDVDFEVPPGVTILFGPSGSGKSTILGVIAGLVRPDAGYVRLGDDVWLDTSARVAWPPERRRVAYVFQSLALFPHMSALENVAYGIDRALEKEARRERARASLARFRAGHLELRRPATFSGGEAQRVALARAFAMSPRVVLLDEPFSALDSDLRYGFASDVRSASRDLGVPVVHVTHDRAEARALGDHVVCIQGGRIEERGDPDMLLAERERPSTAPGRASAPPRHPIGQKERTHGLEDA